jgi:hypothetical protein
MLFVKPIQANTQVNMRAGKAEAPPFPPWTVETVMEFIFPGMPTTQDADTTVVASDDDASGDEGQADPVQSLAVRKKAAENAIFEAQILHKKVWEDAEKPAQSKRAFKALQVLGLGKYVVVDSLSHDMKQNYDKAFVKTDTADPAVVADSELANKIDKTLRAVGVSSQHYQDNRRLNEAWGTNHTKEKFAKEIGSLQARSEQMPRGVIVVEGKKLKAPDGLGWQIETPMPPAKHMARTPAPRGRTSTATPVPNPIATPRSAMSDGAGAGGSKRKRDTPASAPAQGVVIEEAEAADASDPASFSLSQTLLEAQQR